MTLTDHQIRVAVEALARARGRAYSQNDTAVIIAFANRGIDPAAIEPRVNVLTFHAWRALGRTVKRGEHGERIPVWIPAGEERESESADGKKTRRSMRLRTAVVFHVSQTKAFDEPDEVAVAPTAAFALA